MTPPTVLRPVGFVTDMDLGQTWAKTSLALARATSTLSPLELEQLVAYLGAGHPFLDAMIMLEDPLDPGGPSLGPGSIKCDGVWAWPAVLEIILTRHRPSLPDEFVEHVRSRRFQVADVGTTQFTLAGLIDEDGLPGGFSCG